MFVLLIGFVIWRKKRNGGREIAVEHVSQNWMVQSFGNISGQQPVGGNSSPSHSVVQQHKFKNNDTGENGAGEEEEMSHYQQQDDEQLELSDDELENYLSQLHEEVGAGEYSNL